MIHGTTSHTGGLILFGLPIETLIMIVAVPVIVSLALHLWALKW
jgi:hypothetical protein